MISTAARARGAVLGSLVGDAAAVPCHWCYDSSKLAMHLQSAKQGPAFCNPPGNNFYTPEPGGFSCYGDQAMCLLQSLAARGKFDAEDYAKRLAAKFGKDSPYEVAAVNPDDWPELKKNPTGPDGKVIEDQRIWSMPLPGPWRHGSIKGFLKNYVASSKPLPDCGSSDEQVDGCCKVAPIVALLAGHPDLLPMVDKAVRVTQNTDVAAGYACGFSRVLEKLVLGSAQDIASALREAEKDLAQPMRSFKTPVDEEVLQAMGRVLGEFATLSSEEVGRLLKPAAAGFPFAGLA